MAILSFSRVSFWTLSKQHLLYSLIQGFARLRLILFLFFWVQLCEVLQNSILLCCDLFYTVTVLSMLNFIRNVLFSSLALPWVMASCHFCCVLPLLWSCHMFCNPRETILFERSFVANLVFQVFLALVREREYARRCFLPSWFCRTKFCCPGPTIVLGRAILPHPLSFQIFM